MTTMRHVYILILNRHECPYMWINLHAIRYVDGKWGYDESKHHVTGDYGIVNTLHLSADDMDVDNDAFLACGESDIPYS